MRITKFGHACVRIEHDGVALVVDPGMFTKPEAVDGATAVLITHLHPDHYLPDHLRATDAPVFTVVDLADKIRDEAPDVAERVTVVATGEEFDPGLPVTAVGEWHNVIHPELPRPHNSGYLVTVADQRVYHPGDALTEPGVPVDVLLCPSSAPWLRSESGAGSCSVGPSVLLLTRRRVRDLAAREHAGPVFADAVEVIGAWGSGPSASAPPRSTASAPG
jgi:L-ascorbate metabolism protein UlaG (beta-lactamase superfamily)